MKFLKYIFLSLSLVVFFAACDDEDFTGHSSLTPSTPTVSVDVSAYAGGINFTEQDSTFLFTVTLSEPQIVDVAVYIMMADGTASMGSDFVIDNTNSRVTIAAGRTTGTASVTVLRDDVIEDPETFTIQIGDERTANASITPQMISFTINDYDDTALSLGLEWSTPAVFDADGNELGATDVADLIFQMVDASGTVLVESDGGDFEHIDVLETVADGDYELRASFWSVLDAGDLGSSNYDVDVTLTFDQVGVQAGSISIPSALNTANNCVQSDYVVVGTVNKNGATYTIAEDGSTSFSADNPQDIIGGSYTEVHDDGTQPTTTTVSISVPDATTGLFTITDFGFQDAWWCSHTGAEIDLVVDGLEVLFPGGGAGTTQTVRGISDICGYSGPVVELNEVGSWNPCTGVIEINVAIRVDAGTFSSASAIVYTP